MPSGPCAEIEGRKYQGKAVGAKHLLVSPRARSELLALCTETHQRCSTGQPRASECNEPALGEVLHTCTRPNGAPQEACVVPLGRAPFAGVTQGSARCPGLTCLGPLAQLHATYNVRTRSGLTHCVAFELLVRNDRTVSGACRGRPATESKVLQFHLSVECKSQSLHRPSDPLFLVPRSWLAFAALESFCSNDSRPSVPIRRWTRIPSHSCKRSGPQGRHLRRRSKCKKRSGAGA